MNKLEKILIVVGIITAIILSIVALESKPLAHSVVMTGSVAGQGVPSVYDNVSLTGILQTGVNPNGNLNAIPSQFATGTIYAQGGVIQGGNCSIVQASSTLTPNTIYLTASQIFGCTLLSITNGSTTGALAVVLPASSTVTSLANAGDTSDMSIYAASTTAGNIIVQATTTAGFSISSPIGIASTTAASSTYPSGKTGELIVNRLPTTGLNAELIPGI